MTREVIEYLAVHRTGTLAGALIMIFVILVIPHWRPW